MQPTPLQTADPYMLDFSFEFPVKNEFLTVIRVYTVKRLTFLLSNSLQQQDQPQNACLLLFLRTFSGLRASRKCQLELRTCPITPPHIAKLQVFSQSQSQMRQVILKIPDYLSQVKNKFSKTLCVWQAQPLYLSGISI